MIRRLLRRKPKPAPRFVAKRLGRTFMGYETYGVWDNERDYWARVPGYDEFQNVTLWREAKRRARVLNSL